MIPNFDIYRSARLLVKQHGEDAPIHAANRAQKNSILACYGNFRLWL